MTFNIDIDHEIHHHRICRLALKVADYILLQAFALNVLAIKRETETHETHAPKNKLEGIFSVGIHH